MDNSALYIALEHAVPGFVAADVVTPVVDERNGIYKQLLWLDDVLGDVFRCYVEWKEFEPWGLADLNKLLHIRQAGITLLTDSLYDKHVAPLGKLNYYDDGGFFLPVLQQQLQSASLQLLDICTVQNNQPYLQENPRFICTTTEPDKVAQLQQCLKQKELTLVG